MAPARRVVAVLALLAHSAYAFSWVSLSPMARYADQLNSRVYFPPSGPADRFQYGRTLVIGPKEVVDHATCVLCSIDVFGTAGSAETMWGDIVVTGSVGNILEARGGRLEIGPGAIVQPATPSAVGGATSIAAGARLNRSFVNSLPGYFYPGQRSFPWRGVAALVLGAVLAAFCGGWWLGERAAARVDAWVGKPIRTTALACATLAGGVLGWHAAFYALYLFPPLGVALLVGVPLALWLALASGFAALAARLGRTMGLTGPWARTIGALVLVAPMLIPVAGLPVLLVVTVLALGAGSRAFV